MNRSEELCKLLGIKPKYRASFWDFEDRTHFVNSIIFDNIEDAQEYNNDEEFDIEELIIDFTKPDNFVKLLEILTINNLEVVFGTCKYKNTNYYCDIYHYETMTDKNGIIDDLQELFCNIADNPQKAFVSTLLKMFNGDLPIEEIDGKMQENLYNMWEVSICLDYQNVVDKIHEILEEVKHQAQQTDWTY